MGFLIPWCVCVFSHVWLCGPTDCSPPDSSVHGIFQARILKWGSISYSRGSSQTRDRTWVFCVFCLSRQIFFYHECHPGSPILWWLGSKSIWRNRNWKLPIHYLLDPQVWQNIISTIFYSIQASHILDSKEGSIYPLLNGNGRKYLGTMFLRG